MQNPGYELFLHSFSCCIMVKKKASLKAFGKENFQIWLQFSWKALCCGPQTGTLRSNQSGVWKSFSHLPFKNQVQCRGMRAPAPHAQLSQFSFPVPLPINWRTTSRHGKIAGFIFMHIPALFACKAKKVINSDGEYVTWAPVGLRPQIISQVAEQLPKIAFLSALPFSHSLPQKLTQKRWA